MTEWNANRERKLLVRIDRHMSSQQPSRVIQAAHIICFHSVDPAHSSFFQSQLDSLIELWLRLRSILLKDEPMLDDWPDRLSQLLDVNHPRRRFSVAPSLGPKHLAAINGPIQDREVRMFLRQITGEYSLREWCVYGRNQFDAHLNVPPLIIHEGYSIGACWALPRYQLRKFKRPWDPNDPDTDPVIAMLTDLIILRSSQNGVLTTDESARISQLARPYVRNAPGDDVVTLVLMLVEWMTDIGMLRVFVPDEKWTPEPGLRETIEKYATVAWWPWKRFG